MATGSQNQRACRAPLVFVLFPASLLSTGQREKEGKQAGDHAPYFYMVSKSFFLTERSIFGKFRTHLKGHIAVKLKVEGAGRALPSSSSSLEQQALRSLCWLGLMHQYPYWPSRRHLCLLDEELLMVRRTKDTCDISAQTERCSAKAQRHPRGVGCLHATSV